MYSQYAIQVIRMGDLCISVSVTYGRHRSIWLPGHSARAIEGVESVEGVDGIEGVYDVDGLQEVQTY